MQRLVTPQLTVKFIENRAACDVYITAAGLDKHVAADLRQLLGFNEIPKDRKQKRLVAMYQLVDKLTWVYHPDVSEAVPLIGGKNKDRYEALKKEHDVTFGFAMFEKLVAGTRTPGGWYRGGAPSAVDSLPDGASLVGLPADPPAPAPATSQPAQYGVPNYASTLGVVGAQTHAELPPSSFQADPAGSGLRAPAITETVAATQVRSRSALMNANPRSAIRSATCSFPRHCLGRRGVTSFSISRS